MIEYPFSFFTRFSSILKGSSYSERNHSLAIKTIKSTINSNLSDHRENPAKEISKELVFESGVVLKVVEDIENIFNKVLDKVLRANIYEMSEEEQLHFNNIKVGHIQVSNDETHDFYMIDILLFLKNMPDIKIYELKKHLFNKDNEASKLELLRILFHHRYPYVSHVKSSFD